MKTIIITKPGEVKIEERKKPVCGKGEALLKLLYGGICGSDLGTYRGTFAYASYPRIPGHEFSAEIVEIDKNEKLLSQLSEAKTEIIEKTKIKIDCWTKIKNSLKQK